MKIQRAGLMLLFAAAIALAQPPQPAVPAGPPQPPPGNPGMNAPRPPEAPPQPRAARPPMERAMQPGRGGRWWGNPEMVQKLGINSDQQKKMDDIFQQNRLRLIDLNATLQKEEITMEPLMRAEQPDETRILAQIDKVAQARAELEKANARFLLGIRRVLTPDQWKKLEAEQQRDGGNRPPRPAEPGQVRTPGVPRGPAPRPIR